MPIFLTATMALRLKDDLGIGEQALGALFSIFSVGAAIAAPVMGRLAERLGPGPSLRLASGLSGMVMVSIATAAHGWLAIAGLLVVGGIAGTLMQSSSNLWLARTIEDRRMGLAFGLKQSGGPTAALLAGVAVPVVALAFGWRWTFAGFGAFAFVALLSVPRTGLRGVGRAAPSREGDVDLGPLLVLTAGAAVSTALSASFTGFAVTAAVQQGGLSESHAGIVFAVGAMTGIVTRVTLGRWVDGRPDTRFGVPALLVGAGALGFAVLSQGSGSPAAFMVAVPFSFATVWGWVGVFNYAVTRSNATSPAAATGITLVGSNVGVVVGPTVFGFLFARSFAVAWLTAAGGSLLGAALMTLGGSLARRGAAT
jgi:predicted MFS family arabinose efflux permease